MWNTAVTSHHSATVMNTPRVGSTALAHSRDPREPASMSVMLLRPIGYAGRDATRPARAEDPRLRSRDEAEVDDLLRGETGRHQAVALQDRDAAGDPLLVHVPERSAVRRRHVRLHGVDLTDGGRNRGGRLVLVHDLGRLLGVV